MRPRHAVLVLGLVVLLDVAIHDDGNDDENEDQDSGHASDYDTHAFVIDKPENLIRRNFCPFFSLFLALKNLFESLKLSLFNKLFNKT